MSPSDARAYIQKFHRLAIFQGRIDAAERELGVKLFDAFDDPDLIVIFAQTIQDQHAASVPPIPAQET